MIDNLMKMLKDHKLVTEKIQAPQIHQNNRKCDRFSIGNGVYALVSWHQAENQILLGQLIDINEKGCGLSYVSDRNHAVKIQYQKKCRLKIVATYHVIELNENVVIYDHELPQYSTAAIAVRRCGIRFASKTE